MSHSQWRKDDTSAIDGCALKHSTQSAKTYFIASDVEHHAGNTEKATRYLRMAINVYNTELLNQFDIKSLGETNNA